MYLDGVEYFPVSRYVLWGYQFKSVAALGPILGPFIGITYGWLPALLWIIGGNFFIGWLPGYRSVMLSGRQGGRAFWAVSFQFSGAPGPIRRGHPLNPHTPATPMSPSSFQKKNRTRISMSL